MSSVHNYCIIASTYEETEIQMAELNAVIAVDYGSDRQGFLPLHGEGGYKGYEWRIWGMAANYIPLEIVTGAMRKVSWEEPEGVTLIYKGQHDYDRQYVIDWRKEEETEE